MDLLGLALSLALPMDGSRLTGDWRFDVNPTFAIEAPTMEWGAAATVVPGAVLFDPRLEYSEEMGFHNNPRLRRHELHHVNQQAALGPAFWLAYALTGGDPFEPYDARNMAPYYSLSNAEQHDMRDTWTPPDEMRGQFPLLRFEKSGERSSVSFMPGYPRLVSKELTHE